MKNAKTSTEKITDPNQLAVLAAICTLNANFSKRHADMVAYETREKWSQRDFPTAQELQRPDVAAIVPDLISKGWVSTFDDWISDDTDVEFGHHYNITEEGGEVLLNSIADPDISDVFDENLKIALESNW
jgi:hypothetical protein